jgi:hypothetical protein
MLPVVSAQFEVVVGSVFPPITVWCWRRGGFEAEKLSNRTKVVGRIHFPKLQNSHEAKTVLAAKTFGCDRHKPMVYY